MTRATSESYWRCTAYFVLHGTRRELFRKGTHWFGNIRCQAFEVVDEVHPLWGTQLTAL